MAFKRGKIYLDLILFYLQYEFKDIVENEYTKIKK